jgi:AAA+ ATPase superfamily predicted ATPase/Holliday junction resolvase-like predicted endonuclease
VLVDVIVNVVGDGDELNDASSGRADGHEPICTHSRRTEPGEELSTEGRRPDANRLVCEHFRLRTRLPADVLACEPACLHDPCVFRSNQPVTQGAFLDRAHALARLERVAEAARRRTPSWLALIGPRKVGKTSLLLEAARRGESADCRFVVIDVFDALPVSLEIFRRLAGHVLDAVFGVETGASLARAMSRPPEYRSILMGSERFLALQPALRGLVLELPERPADASLVRDAIELPERLARECELSLVVAIDEFQELASVGGRAGVPDPLPLMRSLWQRHERVAYVISGSARSTLTELVTSERSPFFQHFELLELGPFERADAIDLLTRCAPEDRPIPEAVASRAFEVLGGHPFYLQLFGEALTSSPPPYDERALKDALQALLFSRTGRLALYFENEHQRLVGKSTALAATLASLAEGPKRMTDVSKDIGGSTGSANQYLHRLGDAVRKRADERYELDDAAFGAWVRWRAPGGSVVPMRMVGDRAEAVVAEHLSRMGFDLVYQSRGSRGAFDLVAIRGAVQLGVQVKRKPLPLRFPKTEWSRMKADAKKWRWRWIVAAVTDDEAVALLDPAKATMGKEARLGERARIENLLAWLEPPSV